MVSVFSLFEVDENRSGDVGQEKLLTVVRREGPVERQLEQASCRILVPSLLLTSNFLHWLWLLLSDND